MTTAPSSPPDQRRPPLARLVELAVVVPVEVGSRLIEAVPAVVDKVPSAAERVKREIVLARFLGKLVVDQGVRELRSRLTPGHSHGDPATGVDESEQNGTPEAASPAAVVVADVPDVTTLALADYDHLSSAQIVGKLDGLDDAEREAIERYELAGRHRRTILGKLEQLRTASA
ncbi:MAG: hypothetical protein ACM3MM_09235 [Acidobacteriota bacterium]